MSKKEEGGGREKEETTNRIDGMEIFSLSLLRTSCEAKRISSNDGLSGKGRDVT